MKRNLNKLLTFFLTFIFLGFIISSSLIVVANYKDEIYYDFDLDTNEVIPGETVEVSFSINNLHLLPTEQRGVSLFMIKLHYDQDKFHLEEKIRRDNEATISDKHKKNGPQGELDGIDVGDIIIKIDDDYPNEVTIEFLYYYLSKNYFSEDGIILSLWFDVKEDASGAAEFYLVEDHEIGFSTIMTYNDYMEIASSPIKKEVVITSEPTSQNTIAFDSNGGNNIEPLTANYGSEIFAPTPPTKEGYIFDNWYLSNDGGQTLNDEPYTFTTMPNYNFTLYAKWIPIEYTINFDSNGGIGSMSSINALYDQDLTLLPNTFTKEGYKFLGWSHSLSGNVDYNDQGVIKNLRNIPGEVTLYAVWENINYTLFINSPYVKVIRNGTELKNGVYIHYGDVLNITYNHLGYESADILINDNILSGSSFIVGSQDIHINIENEKEEVYQITYNLDGGVNNINNINEYTISTPTFTLLNPTKNGYRFVGWYDAATGGKKITSINQGSTGNKVLYARWQKELTITLEYNDGITLDTSFNVYEGDNYGANLITPTRDGYVFLGWYTDKENGLKRTSNDIAIIDETLYARWGNQEYILTINSPYLTIKRDNQVLNSGTVIYKDDILTINYQRDGYSLATILVNNQEIYSSTYQVQSGHVIVSIKDELPITFLINYELDGGVNDINNIKEYTILTPTFTLLNPTKDGYRFVGWYDAATGGKKITSINQGSTGNKVLYARWQKELTITLEYNDGITLDTSFNVYEGDNYGANLITPTRDGYVFLGWYTAKESGSKVNISDKVTTSHILYARWEVKSYTLTFKSNGGTTVPSITSFYNDYVSKPTDPVKKGYKFIGWFYDDEVFLNQVEFPLNMPNSDLIIYAKWELNQYTISFDSNGGSDVNQITKYYQEKITKPKDPVKEGYIFDGWYIDNNTFENIFIFNLMSDEDITIYAKWLAVYTIIFDYDDNQTTSTTKEVVENEIYGLLPNPTRSGYSFGGWYTKRDGQGDLIESNSIVKISANQTLYAKWNRLQYSIVFNTNGGSSIDTIEEYYNNPIIEPSYPTRSGYYFAGWYLDNNTFNNEYQFTGLMPAANLILHAKWETKKDISITFITNGGSDVIPLTDLEYDTIFTLPETTRKGYKFLGWYLDQTFSQQFLTNRVPAESVVLYAKWEKQQALEDLILSIDIKDFNDNLLKQINIITNYMNVSLDTNINEVFVFVSVNDDSIDCLLYDQENKLITNNLVTLNYGSNIVILKIISEDFEQNYTLNLTRAPKEKSNAIDIYDIIVRGIDSKGNVVDNNLNLYDKDKNKVSFDKNKSIYYLNIPSGLDQIDIQPLVNDSIIKEENLKFKLENIYNGIVSFTVISEDGENENTYYLYLVEEEANKDLIDIQVYDKDNKSYLNNFSTNKYSYNIAIPNNINVIKVLVDVNEEYQVVIKDKNMNVLDPNSIDVTDNEIIFIWLQSNINSEQIYIINIEKQEDINNSYLKNIIITDGFGNVITNRLNTKFNPDNYFYELVVDYDVDEIFIAGQTINGAQIIKGFHTPLLKTLPEVNIIDFICQAPDGTLSTYTFVVYRMIPDGNPKLEYIKVNDKVIETYKDVLDYQIELPINEVGATIVPVPIYKTHQILINGILYKEGVQTIFNLPYEKNYFEIVVIAENKIDTFTYTLLITKEKDESTAKLEDLIIIEDATFKFKSPDGSFIDTHFDPDLSTQYIYVSSQQERITLVPKTSSNSYLKDHNTKEIVVELIDRYTLLPVTVVNPYNNTHQDYFFIILKDGLSNDATIDKLSINNKVMKNISNSNLIPYKLNKKKDRLDLDIVLNHDGATYIIEDNQDLQDGDIVVIKVIAEDKVTENIYLIEIIKENNSFSLTTAYILFWLLLVEIILLFVVSYYSIRKQNKLLQKNASSKP